MASPKLIRGIIRRLLLLHPNLPNAAIARLGGANWRTVAKLRPVQPRHRYETTGRPARGPRPGKPTAKAARWYSRGDGQLKLPGVDDP